MKRCVGLAILLVAVAARADVLEVQRMRFVERGDDLIVTGVKFGKLFDADAFQALSSGFPSTVVISTAVYEKDGTTPVQLELVTRSVVYDVWDEEYVIKFEGDARKPLKVKATAEALKMLTSIDDFAIASVAELP